MGLIKTNTISSDGSQGLFQKDWFLFATAFISFSVFFLIFAGYQFLEGDDAMQAIWVLAKKAGITDTAWIPFHGYQTRSGTFFLIYALSFLFHSPLISYSVLCALCSALTMASLLLYTGAALGARARLSHLVILVCMCPEIIYAGLYMNAAVVGYGFGFAAIYLSIRLVQKNKSSGYFIFSGALFGLALASGMNAAYLAFAFPVQHLFLNQGRNWKAVISKFSVEVVSGAAVYCLVLASMGLTPLDPFLEYGSTMEAYGGAPLMMVVVALLGALHPLTCLLVPAGLVLMLKRKMFLPLCAGIVISFVNFLTLARVLKSFQYGLCVYILIAFCAVLLWESLKKPAFRFIYMLVIVLPLFIGVRLYLPEQPHRGPGFTELDTGQGLDPEGREREGLGGFKIFQSPRINIKGRGIRLALGSGFMLTSVDGGRALAGQFWTWVIDWKKYLEDTNKSADVIIQSGEKNVIAGHYSAAMILMYKLMEQGYKIETPARIVVVQEGVNYNIFQGDAFLKGEKKFTIYWFYIELGGQVDKEIINFGPLEERVGQGVFVSFPTFAYKLEKGSLRIRDYSAQPLGYFCFRIRKKA